MQPITFITFDEYNRFRKKAQNNSKTNYTLSQKVVYTEKPHSRGRAKKGMTRNLYPTLIELLASSLEKVGLTPQNLGWE